MAFFLSAQVRKSAPSGPIIANVPAPRWNSMTTDRLRRSASTLKATAAAVTAEQPSRAIGDADEVESESLARRSP